MKPAGTLAITIVAMTLLLVISQVIRLGQVAYVDRLAGYCTEEGGEPYRFIDRDEVVCFFEPRSLILRRR